jgi:large conductance mechanosensitive channel
MAGEKKSIVTEFKDFLLRGNVVDLAVAVVIGAAFGAVVTALVADILTPIIAAIFGKPDFSSLTFTIHKSHFFYGAFINAVIAFVSIAAAVFFFVVKPVNYLMAARARRMAAGEAEETTTLSDEAILLGEIRDLLRSRAAG